MHGGRRKAWTESVSGTFGEMGVREASKVFSHLIVSPWGDDFAEMAVHLKIGATGDGEARSLDQANP